MERIKRNAIMCLKCGDVMESRHTLDRVFCSCGAAGIDGGYWYSRILGHLDQIELLIDTVEVDEEDEDGSEDVRTSRRQRAFLQP